MEHFNGSNVAPTESYKMSEHNTFLLQPFEYQEICKPTYKTGYRRSAYREVIVCFEWCTQPCQLPNCTNHWSAWTNTLLPGNFTADRRTISLRWRYMFKSQWLTILAIYSSCNYASSIVLTDLQNIPRLIWLHYVPMPLLFPFNNCAWKFRHTT